MSKKLRALLVKENELPVEVEIPNNLTSLQKQVDGYIEYFYMPNIEDAVIICNEEGKICNTITGISTGYLLQSTASVPLLLTPVYKIDTNTYSYYVNSISGHVSVAK